MDNLLSELGDLAPSGYAIGLHIRFASAHLMFQTYPEEWQKEYKENGYLLRDPVIFWGASGGGAVRWSDIKLPDPFNILGKARSHGLLFGAAVSCGPLSSRSIGGAARADREFTSVEISELQTVVEKLHDATEPPKKLTKAQRDALKLVAEGHRYAAAANMLSISESALKVRLNSARQKLAARTTAEAIQRAQEYRLL